MTYAKEIKLTAKEYEIVKRVLCIIGTREDIYPGDFIRSSSYKTRLTPKMSEAAMQRLQVRTY